MKTFKSICIGCGREIEFKHCDLGDIMDDYEITEPSEVGWWDLECPECEWYVQYETVELIVDGDPEGFCAYIETSDQVRNLIKAVMKRSPALIAEIRSELADEETIV